MNILYCGDANIADGLLLSALSLAKHTHENLSIHVLTMGYGGVRPIPQAVADAVERRLQAENPDHTLRLWDCTELFATQPPIANMDTRFTPCCMLRLYADLLPLPDRMLYLDTDVLCRRDFSDFYHQSLHGAQLAGVPDYYGRWFFHRDYLNSGVLLLDLRRIRQTGLFYKCRRRCADKKMFLPDQSALNKLTERKLCLPRRFNEQRKLHSDTVFQHFTTSFRFFPYFHAVSVKPWQTERMHNILKLHEYDSLLGELPQWKQKEGLL